MNMLAKAGIRPAVKGEDQPATKARYRILALIAFATVLNYLDRTLLAVAAPAMSEDLNIGPATLGIVFSVFSWSYAAFQIPGGMLLDRFGTRLTYSLSVAFWSLFTAAQGAVVNVATLVAVRLGLGAAEAPCFPANSRVLVTWFPQRERARANSVYSVGMYFGIAFLSPLLFWVTATFGWRALFVAVGGLGILFGVLFWRQYREPQQSPWANAAELAELEKGGALTPKNAAGALNWRDIGWLLRKRQIYGASIGQFATNSTLVFFLTWFPTYLATERHMEWLQVGFYAVMPFIAASVGVLVAGQISDRVVKRMDSLTLGRKLPIVGGLLLSSTIIVAAFAESNLVVVVVMSVAFFGQGMSNLGWTLISDVAPPRLLGLTGGIFNFCTNLAGIVTPIVIGLIVAATGSFFGGLAFIGVIALLGAFSYVFIVGEVKRIEDPASAA
jgi:ACS family D-galactonate transporter-like MFS transporter